MASTDILLHHIERDAPAGLAQSKVLAFVPITLALLGVAAILAGGVNARPAIASADTIVVDPVVTGTVFKPAADAMLTLDD